MLVDLQALAQSLQELPLHVRLNLDAELIQVPVQPLNVGLVCAEA